ncbi:MAG: HD domain-containing protein [Desulfomonile tiedjei]|nr:HD domain-containing protein [Desulfomonile tiedjei]
MNNDDLGLISTCVKDLQPGTAVLQFFELRSKDVRKTRSGQDYLDLTVGDATGTISCKMWSDALRKWGQDFNPGDFVKIEGRVEAYKDRNQLVVEKIRRVEPSEIPDTASLIRASQSDPEALLEELIALARTLEPPELSDLLEEILVKNADTIKTFPAAKMIHHAYRGGLIEHVCTVTRKVEAILEIEKNINRSIALAGAILHDIGKILELNPRAQGRTLEGRLIGHVILGVGLVRDAAAQKGLEDRPWLMELEHIILSHHGETQFGAPVKPLTREALLVHFIDNLDSKLKIMEEALESVDSEGFTAYNKWLEGRAFAGGGLLPKEDDDVGNSREIG